MRKRIVIRLVTIMAILSGAVEISLAADSSTPIFTTGQYSSAASGPDAMTATASKPIEAKGGSASPVPDESGQTDTVLVDGVSDATVTFSGRSAGHDCFYTTWGVYKGGGGNGGEGTASNWQADFDSNSQPHFVVYVNDLYSSDDNVVYVNNTCTVSVELRNAPEGCGSVAFKLSQQVTAGTASVTFLDDNGEPVDEDTKVYYIQPGTPVKVTVKGVTSEGSLSLTAKQCNEE